METLSFLTGMSWEALAKGSSLTVLFAALVWTAVYFFIKYTDERKMALILSKFATLENVAENLFPKIMSDHPTGPLKMDFVMKNIGSVLSIDERKVIKKKGGLRTVAELALKYVAVPLIASKIIRK